MNRPPLPLGLIALPLALLAAASEARAQLLPPPDPGQQCRTAIAAAERSYGIPVGLMAAIGQVESGRRAADGSITPWPWSIDAEGTGHVYATEGEAIAAVRALQAAGVRSIDTGCMQVNLQHHPDAFPSLEAAFDPVANANYAARFLVQLHQQTGSWPAAAAQYHSATPALAADYERKVMAAWPQAMAEANEPPAAFATAPSPPALGGIGPALGMTGRRVLMPTSSFRQGPTGRSLADYRAAPIPLAARTLPILPRGRG